jgi:hypothetical protein
MSNLTVHLTHPKIWAAKYWILLQGNTPTLCLLLAQQQLSELGTVMLSESPYFPSHAVYDFYLLQMKGSHLKNAVEVK